MTISLKADSSGTFGEVLVNGSPALKVSNGLLELPDGKDFFNQGNIVGTVSQSGGVPTGAVVERGSNANGKYVRFADGTQICTRQVNLGNVTIGGNSFSTNLAPLYGTFPAAFVDPNISMSYSQNSGWSYAFVLADEGVSTTAIGGWYLARIGDMLGVGDTIPHTVRYTAIGRWF